MSSESDSRLVSCGSCDSACSMAAEPSLQPQLTSTSSRSAAGCCSAAVPSRKQLRRSSRCSCRHRPGRSPAVMRSRLLPCALTASRSSLEKLDSSQSQPSAVPARVLSSRPVTFVK
jgi:hypothetical protein